MPAVLAASLPIVVLVALVVRRWSLAAAAAAATATAALLAATVFELEPIGYVAAGLDGVWTGVWIVLIVAPALLLFEVLERSGAIAHLADATEQLAPDRGRWLLLTAWVLPSFLQGAAGFGTPVAMTAPMLVRGGLTPVRAVSTCLIGYCWAVTFGSMGSSYFVAAATARLGSGEAVAFATAAAVVLAVVGLVAGLVVLRRGGGGWRDAPVAVALAAVMGTTLVVTVRTQPALGSTLAGLAGLVTAWILLPGRRGTRPAGRDLWLAALPYGVLALSVTIAFGVPAVRGLLDGVPAVAPVLPGSEAAGLVNPRAPVTPEFRPLLHPWAHVLLATVVGTVVYRRTGTWPVGSTRAAVRGWVARAWPVSLSIVVLTVLAAVMVEAGMLAALGRAAVDTLDRAVLVVAPALGTLGSALTGSTTASNALFSSFQVEVARGLDLPAAVLLAGQTAGGNVGNAIAPINVAVGAAAVGLVGREASVIRDDIRPALLLLAVVITATVILAAVA